MNYRAIKNNCLRPIHSILQLKHGKIFYKLEMFHFIIINHHLRIFPCIAYFQTRDNVFPMGQLMGKMSNPRNNTSIHPNCNNAKLIWLRCSVITKTLAGNDVQNHNSDVYCCSILSWKRSAVLFKLYAIYNIAYLKKRNKKSFPKLYSTNIMLFAVCLQIFSFHVTDCSDNRRA